MNASKKNRQTRQIPPSKPSADTSPADEPQAPTVGQEEQLLSQHAAQMLVEFFASIEHEFRTPLAIIKGYASMLLRQGQHTLSQDQRESLQAIQDAEGRLEVLTNRLLEIAQLEAGLLALTLSPVNLPVLAHEMITHAQQQLPEVLQDRFTFALHLRDQQGKPAQDIPWISADLLSLRKILKELLENAMRFSPQGGRIDIIIGPAPLTAAPGVFQPSLPTYPFVELCVCDTGIGIPEEQLERIFEQFYQVDTRLTREVNGLGLGLALCRELVALHQGHIWAKSCPAGGSAFHLWLPLEERPVVA